MLLAIREKVTGVVALAFVAVIALLMVVPLLYDYVVGLGSRDAMEVAGEKVSVQAYNQRLSDTRQRLMQAFGNQIPESVDVDALVKQQTIDAIINERVLNAASIEDGFRLANVDIERQIMQDPAFMQNGQFDQDLYERQITAAGYTHNYYKQVFGQQAAQRQLVDGVINSAFASNAQIAKLAALQKQIRDVDVVRLNAADYASKIQISDAEIDQYYQEHKQDFQVPEKVVVNYIALNIQDFKDQVKLSEEDIVSEYETGIAAKRYSVPELRSASHILLNLAEDADAATTAKVADEAEKLYEQLNNGADFATLAKQFSQDEGSKENGGSLGEVARGVMVPSFEDAVYSQAQGVIGKPFKTRFGYHIVRVDSITPAENKSLDEVRAQIRDMLINNRARAAYDEANTELANLSDEYPENLEPIASTMKLAMQTSAPFSRDSGEGVFNDANVRNLAFSDYVLSESHNSEVFSISENQSIILRVKELQESHPKSLSEAKPEVIAALKQNKTTALIDAQIASLEQQLAKGADLKQSTQELGLKVTSYGALSRSGTEDLGSAELSSIFAASHPSQDKPTIGTADSANGKILFVLHKVTDGDVASLDESEKTQYRNLIRGSAGMADFSTMLADLRSKAKIWISPQIDNIEH